MVTYSKRALLLKTEDEYKGLYIDGELIAHGYSLLPEIYLSAFEISENDFEEKKLSETDDKKVEHEVSFPKKILDFHFSY